MSPGQRLVASSRCHARRETPCPWPLGESVNHPRDAVPVPEVKGATGATARCASAAGPALRLHESWTGFANAPNDPPTIVVPSSVNGSAPNAPGTNSGQSRLISRLILERISCRRLFLHSLVLSTTTPLRASARAHALDSSGPSGPSGPSGALACSGRRRVAAEASASAGADRLALGGESMDGQNCGEIIGIS